MRRITTEDCGDFTTKAMSIAEEAAKKKMADFRALIEMVYGYRQRMREDDVMALVYRQYEGTEREEKWVFFYTPGQRAELLRTFGRMAADPKLGFTWEAAARCCQRVRSERNE